MKLLKLTRPEGAIIRTLSDLWTNAKAVLFDFDGVLADSEPFYRKSWNTVLSDFDHSVSEEDYWNYWAFLGEGLEGEIRRKGLRIDDAAALKTRQKELYTEYCMSNRIPLFPYTESILEMTMSLKPCAIASNTDSSLIKSITGSKIDHLPPVIGGEGLRAKPFPDIFLKASEFLSVSPSECLVFEDALKGVNAAVSAEIPVVLVRNRYNTDLEAPDASCQIQGLKELYTFLKGCL